MAFDDLKDQLKDQWTELRGKIEESPAFHSLRERYETLSTNAQLGVKIGAAVFTVLILIYFPYSYFSASSDNISVFEEKRGLIRSLLRASHTANEAGGVENPPAASQLIETVRSQLATFSLLPEQIGEINSIPPEDLGGRYAPKEIEQEGIGVNLKKLNLKQLIDIGHGLSGLTQGVRLVGLDVRAASPDPHYFDVVYKLARFSLPMAASLPESKSTRGSGRTRPSPEPSDAEDEK